MQVGELSTNVEALLMAVKACRDWEDQMAERFGGPAQPALDEVHSALPALFPYICNIRTALARFIV